MILARYYITFSYNTRSAGNLVQGNALVNVLKDTLDEPLTESVIAEIAFGLEKSRESLCVPSSLLILFIYRTKHPSEGDHSQHVTRS